MATTDTERYVRVTLLTFKGGIWISKKILCREVDRTTGSPTLAAILLNKKPLLTQKRNHREITRKQFEILFPPNGDDTDIDQWDLSLLVKMILILFGPGLPGIEKFRLNELLTVRNEVMCHTRDPAITEQEFQSIWTQLIISLNTLASSFDADTIQYVSDMIGELSKGPLDLQSSVEKLAQLCRHEEHMENVLTSLSRLERRQDQIATGVVSANHKLDDVLAGVKELLRIGDRREQEEYREEIPILSSRVCIAGKTEVVKLAENIVLKVLKCAIDKTDDPTNDEKVRQAVEQFLTDLETKHAIAESAESGSIILNIKCHNLTGLEHMLTLFKIDGRSFRLVGLENALSELFQDKMKVTIVLPDETVEVLRDWIDSQLSDAPRSPSDEFKHKRKLNLGIRCESAASVLQVIQYFQSGDAANRLNQLSEALSEALGDTIKIDATLDLEGFHEALLRSMEKTPSLSASEQPELLDQPEASGSPGSQGSSGSPGLPGSQGFPRIPEPLRSPVSPRSPGPTGSPELSGSALLLTPQTSLSERLIPKLQNEGQNRPSMKEYMYTPEYIHPVELPGTDTSIDLKTSDIYQDFSTTDDFARIIDTSINDIDSQSIIDPSESTRPEALDNSVWAQCDDDDHADTDDDNVTIREPTRTYVYPKMEETENVGKVHVSEWSHGNDKPSTRKHISDYKSTEVDPGITEPQSVIIPPTGYLTFSRLDPVISESSRSATLDSSTEEDILLTSESEHMQAIGRRLRQIGCELHDQNDERFRRLLNECDASDITVWEVASQVMADGISWGRIVALSHFAPRVAWRRWQQSGILDDICLRIFEWSVMIGIDATSAAIQTYGI